jgi:hypothetical protein
MPDRAAPSRRRRPRRRPFGVLAICALLVFQAVLLLLTLLTLLAVDTSDAGDTELALRAFGLSFTILADATMAVRILIAVIGSLLILTFVQVVLLLLLKRIGWVITMLVAGFSLFTLLVAAWQGGRTDGLSMLLYALTALYLNQSEVRRAFGMTGGSIDAALARSADVVAGDVMGEAS